MSLLARLSIIAAAGLCLTASAAWAGPRCVNCYERVIQPAVYGVQATRVMTRAPRTVSVIAQPVYRTVAEKVVVPGRRVWATRRDARGRLVGCWIQEPSRTVLRRRQILVSAPAMVPVAVPARFGIQTQPVLLEPARAAWVPIMHR